MCVFLFLSFLAFKFQIPCCLYHFQVFLNHEKKHLTVNFGQANHNWRNVQTLPSLYIYQDIQTASAVPLPCISLVFQSKWVNFYDDGPAMNLLLYLLPVHVHTVVGSAIIKHSSNHSIFLSNLHSVLIFSVVPFLPFFQPYLCFILLCFRHQIKPSTFTHLRWEDVTFVHAALRLRNLHPYLSLLYPSLKKHVDHNLV